MYLFIFCTYAYYEKIANGFSFDKAVVIDVFRIHIFFLIFIVKFNF